MKRTINFLLIFLIALIVFTGFIVACGDDDDADDNDDDSADDDDDSADDDDDSADDDDMSDNPDVYADEASGLIWQNGVSETALELATAWDYCQTLEFAGFDDWTLPSISQLRSLVRGCPNTEADGVCTLTDDCSFYESCWIWECNGCNDWVLEGPGPQGQYWPPQVEGVVDQYWSSTRDSWDSNYGYFIDFATASVGSISELGTNHVRCVR